MTIALPSGFTQQSIVETVGFCFDGIAELSFEPITLDDFLAHQLERPTDLPHVTLEDMEQAIERGATGHVDDLLLEGLESGEPTPLTLDDRRDIHEQVRSHGARRQDASPGTSDPESMGPGTVHLEIPNDVLDSAKMTLAELRTELAIHLYEEGRLSLGKAHELAGVSLWDFRQILGSRGIPPHLDSDDLDQDLETLRKLET